MFESLTPNFLENDAPGDALAYELVPRSPIYPLIAEKSVAKGVIYQLSLAARDILVIPFAMFAPGAKKESRKYAFASAVSLFSAFFILNYFKLTVDNIFTWLAKQKYYKLWALYTIIYISSKFVPKLHSFAHSAIRGGIRANGFMLGPILVNILADVYLFIHQIFVIGTFVAGIHGKQGYFFSAVMHDQFIYYKKFIPKATEGNPFLTESLNRIYAFFSVLLMINEKGFTSESLVILGFEYGFMYGRFLLLSLTDDGQVFLEKLGKSAKKAGNEMRGDLEGSVNDSIFILSMHEGIALVFAMVFMHVCVPMKIFVVAALGLIAAFSLVCLQKVENKSETVKDEKPGEVKELNKEENEKPGEKEKNEKPVENEVEKECDDKTEKDEKPEEEQKNEEHVENECDNKHENDDKPEEEQKNENDSKEEVEGKLEEK